MPMPSSDQRMTARGGDGPLLRLRVRAHGMTCVKRWHVEDSSWHVRALAAPAKQMSTSTFSGRSARSRDEEAACGCG